MRLALAVLTLSTAFLWLMLVTDHHSVADSACPVRPVMVRYPAHLGGPHAAVCNPTGIVWR